VEPLRQRCTCFVCFFVQRQHRKPNKHKRTDAGSSAAILSDDGFPMAICLMYARAKARYPGSSRSCIRNASKVCLGTLTVISVSMAAVCPRQRILFLNVFSILSFLFAGFCGPAVGIPAAGPTVYLIQIDITGRHALSSSFGCLLCLSRDNYFSAFASSCR